MRQMQTRERPADARRRPWVWGWREGGGGEEQGGSVRAAGAEAEEERRVPHVHATTRDTPPPPARPRLRPPTAFSVSYNPHCAASLLRSTLTVMDAVVYRQYSGESELPHIMALVQHELSEPYVIYTYRYFLQQWCALFFSSSRSLLNGLVSIFLALHAQATSRVPCKSGPSPLNGLS